MFKKIGDQLFIGSGIKKRLDISMYEAVKLNDRPTYISSYSW